MGALRSKTEGLLQSIDKIFGLFGSLGEFVRHIDAGRRQQDVVILEASRNAADHSLVPVMSGRSEVPPPFTPVAAVFISYDKCLNDV